MREFLFFSDTESVRGSVDENVATYIHNGNSIHTDCTYMCHPLMGGVKSSKKGLIASNRQKKKKKTINKKKTQIKETLSHVQEPGHKMNKTKEAVRAYLRYRPGNPRGAAEKG